MGNGVWSNILILLGLMAVIGCLFDVKRCEREMVFAAYGGCGSILRL